MSRHRSSIRQYIKDKPTKWGIKLWVLTDSSNVYTVDFNDHIGKAAGQEVSANGLGYVVVTAQNLRDLFLTRAIIYL